MKQPWVLSPAVAPSPSPLTVAHLMTPQGCSSDECAAHSAVFESLCALNSAVDRSFGGTSSLFECEDPFAPTPPEARSLRGKIASKVKGQFGGLPSATVAGSPGAHTAEERRCYIDSLGEALSGASKRNRRGSNAEIIRPTGKEGDETPDKHVVSYDARSGALVASGGADISEVATGIKCGGGLAVPVRRVPAKVPVPAWHPPWKLASVVSGHLGWVRSVAFEPANEWFATGGTPTAREKGAKAALQFGSPLIVRLFVSASKS